MKAMRGVVPPKSKQNDKAKEEIRRIKFEKSSFKPDAKIAKTVLTDQLGGYVDESGGGFNNNMVRNNRCPVCGEEWIPYCNDDEFIGIPVVGEKKAVLVCKWHKEYYLQSLQQPQPF